MASRALARGSMAAVLLAAGLVPWAGAAPAAEGLAAYLDLVRRFRSGDPDGAGAALAGWPPGRIHDAVSDLTGHPEWVGPCPGGRARAVVGLVEVEAAALMHFQVAAGSPLGRESERTPPHLREAQRLVELAHETSRGWSERRPPPLIEEGCDATPRVSRRDFYAATAGLCVLLGQPRAALRAAALGLDLAPDDALLLLAAASAHEQWGLVSAQYVEAPFLAPASLEDRIRGHRERPEHVGRLEEENARAVRLLRDALARRPDLAQARLRLGRLLAQRGDLDAALRELEAAARGTDAESRYLAELFLGGLREEQSDLEGAESHYRRALLAHPQTQAARLALAHVEGLAGRPDSARALVLETLSAAWPRDNAADPWWGYTFGSWRDAKRLFDEMSEAVRAP